MRSRSIKTIAVFLAVLALLFIVAVPPVIVHGQDEPDGSAPQPASDEPDGSAPQPSDDEPDGTAPQPGDLNLKNAAITLDNPLGAKTTVTSLIKSVFKALRNIMFAIVPIIVVIGAFQMMFAAGNPEKFATGQKTIVYAVIGLIVIIVANGIVAIVHSILTGGTT